MLKKHLIYGLTILIIILSVSIVQAQTRRVMLDGSTSVMLREANAVLTEEAGAVTVMMLLGNHQPEGTKKVDIKKGDEVMGINGKRTKTVAAFNEVYNAIEVAAEVKIGLQRGDDMFFITFPKMDPEAAPSGGVRMITRRRDGSVGGDLQLKPYTGEGFVVEGKEEKTVITMVLPNLKRALPGADIEENDVIVSLNGKEAGNFNKFTQAYDALKTGDDVELVLKRGEKEISVSYKKPEPGKGGTFRTRKE